MRAWMYWAIAGLAIVFAALASHGCGSEDNKNPATPVTAADVLITITGISGGNSFSPNPANVTVGQTVAWRNSGGTTHTATQNGGAGFNTGNIQNGYTSAPIAIMTAGNLGYHCEIHTTMVGTLNVTP